MDRITVIANIPQPPPADAPLTADHVAAAINTEHEAVCRAVSTGLEHARRAGELLTRAKAELPHGAWLPWLAEHCPRLTPRTAQGYMRIFAKWDALEANTPGVAHLPLREALAFLAEPREPLQIPERWPDDADGIVDWPARTAAMEEAWDALTAALDEMSARIGRATNLEEAVDNLRAAEELEGRAIALHAGTIRDLRRLTRTLATLLDVPLEAIRPLTDPDACAAFLTACDARIRELDEAGR